MHSQGAVDQIKAFANSNVFLQEVVVDEVDLYLGGDELRGYDRDRDRFVILLLEGRERTRAGHWKLRAFAFVTINRDGDLRVDPFRVWADLDAYGVIDGGAGSGLGSMVVREAARVVGTSRGRWEAEAMVGTVAHSNIKSMRAMASGVRRALWPTAGLAHDEGQTTMFGRAQDYEHFFFENVEAIIPRSSREVRFTGSEERQSIRQGRWNGYTQVWFFRRRPGQQVLRKLEGRLLWTWHLESREIDVLQNLPKGELVKLRAVENRPRPLSILEAPIY